MDAPAHRRELAYRIWRENGQSIVNTVKALEKDHSYEITRQSLAKWRDEFGWEDRAARAEASEKDRAASTSDASIMDSLLKRRAQYETYLESLPLGQVDNQAIYGYNSVLKTILDVRKETAAFKVDEFGKFFRELIEFLRGSDPEAAAIVAANFDDFTNFVRMKYVG